LLVASPQRRLSAQSSWDRYKPGTLAAIIDGHDSTIRATWRGRPSSYFSGNDFPTIARVVYVGSSRPIDPNRLDVLRGWGKMRSDTSIVQEVHREYLFEEGKHRMWLMVQDTVASFFPRELHPGQSVNVYVSWLGAYYEGRDITWAFIVNEFEAVKKTETIQ
jgi:hypothetical protein